MSNKLQESVIPRNAADQEVPSRTDSDSSNKTNRHKSLFGCCFKIVRKKKSENAVDYDPEEYDYIVEKLVVKRVPLAFFAVSKDVSSREKNDLGEGTSQSLPFPATETKSVYSGISENQSLLYHSKTTDQNKASNTTPGKSLRFDKDANELNESNVCVSSTDYDAYEEQKVRVTELMDTLSALHPDLKESERPPKDPCPLNMPRSKRPFAENITEAASIKKTVSGDNRSQISETFRATSAEEHAPTREKSKVTRALIDSRKLNSSSYLFSGSGSSKHYDNKSENEQDDINSKRVQDMSYSDKSRDDNSSEEKTEFIISPVQLQHMSHNLKDLERKETDAHQWDAEHFYQKHSGRKLQEANDTLQCTQQISRNKSALLSESFKNTGTSGTVLRWKIIIKHREPE